MQAPPLTSLMALVRRKHAAPIVCASIGRVGSTLTFRAIVQARTKAVFGISHNQFARRIRATAWELSQTNFEPCRVYKTHDFPDGLASASPVKAIFLYGRPSDSVLSVIRCHRTRGPEFIKNHFSRMHADGDFDQLLHRDVLRMEEQIAAWRAVGNANVLGIRYEKLWENIGLVNRFLGLEIALPPRSGRLFSGLDPQLVSQARKTYAELDRSVSELPDHFFSPL